ncbi:MAG: T9SS type A sorting domain-containing protein [Bacteroidetes bacterium]|nr:T9SS type A sorting domain-containing protein [Bacteroidota bacterium]
MKKILLFILTLHLIATQQLAAQCVETPKPKVLLVGDSWAFFMNTDQTFNNALKNWGHSNYKFVSNTVVAENGAEAPDFMTTTKQNEIQNLINQNPSIEVIHLSIGGNDMMGDWKVSMTPGALDTLGNNVQANIDSVIRFLKSTKPGMRVVWGGYTYPNFGEVINTSPLQSSHPFYQTWQDMEFPSFIDINNLLNRFSDTVATKAAADPLLDFVNATGLMQYTFGQSSPLGVPPGGTYAAMSVPLPLGDPNYPSPAVSMRDYFVTKDCFHLSAPGYLALIEYNIQKFYHKLFMDDFYALSENNNQTGSVSSTGNISTSLLVGESAGESFSTVLSFNTSGMADTTLSKASIFLRREALNGSNPVSGTLDVKMKIGNFGATAAVEAADYSAASDMNGTPCRFGDNNTNHWIRLDLPASFLSLITNQAPVQFMISAPGFTGGTVTFSNTDEPEWAPVLNLAYGETPSAVGEIATLDKFKLYPNPVNDVMQLDIDLGTVVRVEIHNTMGQLMPVNVTSYNTISTSNLTAGNYIITVVTEDGIGSQRFVKQ